VTANGGGGAGWACRVFLNAILSAIHCPGHEGVTFPHRDLRGKRIALRKFDQSPCHLVWGPSPRANVAPGNRGGFSQEGAKAACRPSGYRALERIALRKSDTTRSPAIVTSVRRPVHVQPILVGLDRGEMEAIALAVSMKADLNTSG
jgi:hypothetical protein